MTVSLNSSNHEDLNLEKSLKYVIANPMERKEEYVGDFEERVALSVRVVKSAAVRHPDNEA